MRIGILGYGSIGQRHVGNLRKLGHQIAIYDPDFEGTMVREKVLEWGEAFVIASPTSEHAKDIVDIRRDCHIFCEKPIANKISTETLTRVTMVGYNLRFHPSILKAREWLEAERVGPPLWANFLCAQYNDKPAYRRDGVVLNWSHEIDLALHLLGPAKVVASSIDKDDTIADIFLVHDNGCRTSIHLDYVTKPELRGFNIIGPKGSLIANLPGRNIVHIGTDGTPKWGESYEGSYDNDYIEEMNAFIGRVNGEQTIGCSAQEAIDVLKICLEAKKGSKRG